ncbi:MAG TPA: DNA-processing protein DprA [Candidatus Binataceae bacterium]|nr:DNA-processing protein DprA [Candidatus Binataceae bacterium]
MPASIDSLWLALRRVPGVGPRTARLLLEKFGAPEKIFAATAAEIAAAGVQSKVAHAVAAFRDFEPLERELCELPRIGAQLLRWTDPDYPAMLREIPDPPPYLFVRGQPPPADTRYVAVVGARAASDAGRRMARRLGFELAAKGFAVVSGLARGIDAEAHQGALDAGGTTLAILGCGVDVIYPAEHRALADAIIASSGAILSELPIGTQPLPENFPTRNRIISGLSLGVVIVEAAEKSGSLITARMALEQNRQVFAVPGSPLGGKASGSNRLIKQGAVLVDCVEDVLEELAPQLIPPPIADADGAKAARKSHRDGGTPPKSAASARLKSVDRILESSDLTIKAAKSIILELRDDTKLHVDALIEASGLDAQTVLRLLLELELKGIVAQHPGKLFSLA